MSKRKSSPSPPAAPASLTYEQAVAELETLIDRMESGETPLEESLADYERGVGLLKRCREIITQAEQKIEYLKAAARSDDDESADSDAGATAPRDDMESDQAEDDSNR